MNKTYQNKPNLYIFANFVCTSIKSALKALTGANLNGNQHFWACLIYKTNKIDLFINNLQICNTNNLITTRPSFYDAPSFF